MGCLYNLDWDTDMCQMVDRDENDKPIGNMPGGCDEKGYCICDSDEDPNYMCESYETDNPCYECGADLNIEECECED